MLGSNCVSAVHPDAHEFPLFKASFILAGFGGVFSECTSLRKRQSTLLDVDCSQRSMVRIIGFTYHRRQLCFGLVFMMPHVTPETSATSRYVKKNINYSFLILKHSLPLKKMKLGFKKLRFGGGGGSLKRNRVYTYDYDDYDFHEEHYYHNLLFMHVAARCFTRDGRTWLPGVSSSLGIAA